MNWRRHFAEAATLLAVSVLVALIANALAGSRRKLAVPGDYPNATTLPERSAPGVSPAAPDGPATESAPPDGTAPVGAPSGTAPAPTPGAALPAPSVAPAATPVATPAAKGAAAPTPLAKPERLTDRFPPHPDRPWVEVSGEQVAWLHARGALFLDARRTNVYEEGHIAGARPFSVWEADVDSKIEALVGEGRDDREPIVVYCSGGECEDSHMLAQKLFGAGFENVLVYKDGWPDWVKRGGRTKAGGAP